MASSEDTVVRRLRAIIFVMFGLGIAAGIVGNGDVRFFVCCFFVPGGWAYLRPRWPAIVIWMMWASMIGMLGILLALGGYTALLGSTAHWLMLIVAGLLFLALPIVRQMHDAPPQIHGRSRIPEARVYQRADRG